MPRACLPALLLLAGCLGPLSVAASGPAGPDALGCALDQAAARGYVVDRAEAGVYVRLRQPQRSVLGPVYDEFDVLTATAGRRLTVTATAEELGTETASRPTRRARDDAQAVVDACADGPARTESAAKTGR